MNSLVVKSHIGFQCMLTIVLVACALSLVRVKHQARTLFIELERAQTISHQLDIEWAQLQLEQSILGKNARIALLAQRSLHMIVPPATQITYLTVTHP